MEDSRIVDSVYTEINLNSLFRDRGTSSQPTFIINPSIHADYIKVKNAQIPLTFNQVNSSNSKVVFYEGDSPSNLRTFMLDSGNYDPTTLSSQISKKMNTSGTQTYTVSVDAATQKLKIVGDGNKQFKLKFGQGFGNSNKVLGYDPETETSMATTQESKRGINLNSIEAVYITCSNLSMNTLTIGYNGNVLCKIPLTSPQNSWNIYDNSQCNYDIIPSDSTINDMTFSILDCDSLQPLDLNDSNWSLTLSVWS